MIAKCGFFDMYDDRYDNIRELRAAVATFVTQIGRDNLISVTDTGQFYIQHGFQHGCVTVWYWSEAT